DRLDSGWHGSSQPHRRVIVGNERDHFNCASYRQSGKTRRSAAVTAPLDSLLGSYGLRGFGSAPLDGIKGNSVRGAGIHLRHVRFPSDVKKRFRRSSFALREQLWKYQSITQLLCAATLLSIYEAVGCVRTIHWVRTSFVIGGIVSLKAGIGGTTMEEGVVLVDHGRSDPWSYKFLGVGRSDLRMAWRVALPAAINFVLHSSYQPVSASLGICSLDSVDARRGCGCGLGHPYTPRIHAYRIVVS